MPSYFTDQRDVRTRVREAIFCSIPNQGRFRRVPGSRALSQKALAAPALFSDKESLTELIGYVNALLAAFGENPLPDDTDAANLLDRLRAVADRLESGKSREKAALGLSMARRRLGARRVLASRSPARSTDVTRTRANVAALGGDWNRLSDETRALILRETARRRG